MKKRHLDRSRAALSRCAVERPLYFAFAFASPDLDDLGEVLAGRPGHGPSTEQMEVDVVDGLAAVFAGIDDDTVAAIQFSTAGDLCRHGQQVAEQRSMFGGCLRLRSNMLFGNDEQVSGGLRTDIGKDDTEFVFVHTVRRNFTSYDFAE